jgi:hypothetical protein
MALMVSSSRILLFLAEARFCISIYRCGTFVRATGYSSPGGRSNTGYQLASAPWRSWPHFGIGASVFARAGSSVDPTCGGDDRPGNATSGLFGRLDRGRSILDLRIDAGPASPTTTAIK